MKKYLLKLMNGQDLTESEMIEVMDNIMSGNVTEAQIASFLTALKIKGEVVSEIVGGAKILRQKAEKVDLSAYYTVDTCGTGGDKSGTYNISTAVAIVVAASGLKVVKHGNRSVSSKCGSADVLETLGIKIDLQPEKVKKCVEEIGIGFFYAPVFHNAMRYVGKTRKEMGVSTIFNILGPLANPASANAQVLGVFDEKLTEIMAEVLKNLRVKRALVVHGKDGLDEFSITVETKVTELKDNKLKSYIVKPQDFGLESADIKEVIGGDSKENANIIIDIFNGKKGPKRDILVLNAGAALYVGEKVDSITEGIKLASKLIDEGKVINKLEEFIAYSNKV
jgi:anthranilate phosphoribosyltransferase